MYGSEHGASEPADHEAPAESGGAPLSAHFLPATEHRAPWVF